MSLFQEETYLQAIKCSEVSLRMYHWMYHCIMLKIHRKTKQTTRSQPCLHSMNITPFSVASHKSKLLHFCNSINIYSMLYSIKLGLFFFFIFCYSYESNSDGETAFFFLILNRELLYLHITVYKINSSYLQILVLFIHSKHHNLLFISEDSKAFCFYFNTEFNTCSICFGSN